MARPKGSKSNPNRKPLPFKKRSVERAYKGVRAAGLTPTAIKFYQTGDFTIYTSPTGDAVDLNEANPWDKLLRKKDAEG
jgi:hypothetical protein